MMYELPTSLEIGGVKYEIRSDYRAVLDICAALSDPDLTDNDRAFAILTIFYPDFEEMPADYYEEAIRTCFWFINCGDEEQNQKAPKLMDWEQDFKHIVSPINRVMGTEVRAAEYVHWWTFISAYYEIGDCLFAQIVRIRKQKASNKALDKSDREWYRQNRHFVDLKQRYTQEEDEFFKRWTGEK